MQSKLPKPKVNHFFSQQLKQSYNYEAESIVQKKNFLDIDNRLSKKPSNQPQQEISRTASTKIEFYQQQLRQMDQINQNFIQKLATSQLQLKQYHFDIIKLNEQINNLERNNTQIYQKYQHTVKQLKDNQKYIGDLEFKMKGIEEIISKLYNTITSSNQSPNIYKDLEYIFNTDSTIQKQLQTICYVMLQCCRENNTLRKTLAEQDHMIVKLNQKTNHYIESNLNLTTKLNMEGTKLLSDCEMFPSTITFDDNTENKYRLSPFKTPYKSKYQTVDKMCCVRDSRKTKGFRAREYQIDKNWQKDKLKSQLKDIDGEIQKLQVKIIQQMKN